MQMNKKVVTNTLAGKKDGTDGRILCNQHRLDWR